MKMTTRKTTTGYRVTIDLDRWQEKFDFYEDVRVCFKDISRNYNLSEVTSDFKLYDWQIEYLLGEKSKDELLEDDVYRTDEDFKELDEYKSKYEVVGLSFGEHSNIHIGFGNDGVMLVEKDASMSFIEELVKELDAWFNGWIYRIDVYKPVKFTSDEFIPRRLTYWDFVDGQGGYFDYQAALDSLPDYAGEIIKESETERFEDIERC